MTGRTDRGRKRPKNEDAVLVRAERGLLAVADGMGGHAAGEVASRLAIEAVERSCDDGTDAPSPEALAELLAAATRAANGSILERAQRNTDEAGMGTTLTTLALGPAHAAWAIAHIGDSRAYLLRDGTLTQLTTDHTWVQEQVERGVLTPAQARSHPMGSVLTHALGVDDEPRIDRLTGTLADDDVLLLCSDGLTAMLDDAAIEALLVADARLDAAAERLVETANARGGHDNITVALCRVTA